MIFIDWLTVYQDFTEFSPRLVGEIRTYTDGITGELIKETTTGYKHEGSFDSSILIKFDGFRLYMSGNPSAWCRRDNLFGCRSVRSALDVFNSILTGLGYPEFFDCEDTFLRAKPFQRSESYFHSGLNFTRIDITKNFSSSLAPIEMLRYLSSFNYRGQCGYLYPNGRTVDWLGSRIGDIEASKRLYFKYYDKSFDIEIKLNKLIRRRDRLNVFQDNYVSNKNFLDSQISYLSKLLLFTVENNVIRFELELKGKTLSEMKLNRLVGWNDDTMIILLEKYLPHVKQVVSFQSKVDLYSQLVAVDVKPAYAKTAAAYGQMWLDGHDIHFLRSSLISKSTFYRVRKNLLLIGFDISSPLNMVHFPTQVKTVSLGSLPVPDWYQAA